MTHRGKRSTLKVEPSSSRQRLGDEALKCPRSIPEVLQEKWPLFKCEKLWKELSLYAQHGHPPKASDYELRRLYRETRLVLYSKGSTHKFFWDIAARRLLSRARLLQLSGRRLLLTLSSSSLMWNPYPCHLCLRVARREK